MLELVTEPATVKGSLNLAAAPRLDRALGFNWQLSELHGWGLVGVHTALYLLDYGCVPLLLAEPQLHSMRPGVRARLEPCLAISEQFRVHVNVCMGRPVAITNADLMCALNDRLEPSLEDQAIRGVRNFGVGAFCSTDFPARTIEALLQYDRMVVHSSFNRQVLEEHGIVNVATCFQGVDATEVGPGPRPGKYPGRFVVFSGGKLEFRKGQDIVLAAFRVFHQRHPDALLVTGWTNLWPGFAQSIAESPLVLAPLTFEDGRLNIAKWIAAQGLPPEGFHCLDFLGRDSLAPVLRDCDLAVFPNRCEPGTNLVAMEAMACGVPVVLSANTGHLDLIDYGRCFRLSDQQPVHSPCGSRRYWGESSVEELLETMEQVYHSREAARVIGEAGGHFVLAERTWAAFAKAFVALAAV